MKNYTKLVVVALVLTAVSTVGFGTAYGYGSTSGSRARTIVNNPVITAAPFAGCTAGAAFSTTTGLSCAGAPAVGEVLGASTFKFTTYLSFGMTSDMVKELQERLRAEGFFTYPTSTGYFGPITLAAVKAYQTAHAIPATGLVGPLTIAELNK